jgi:hypothetical protein
VATNRVRVRLATLLPLSGARAELRDIELVHNAIDEHSLSLLITGALENGKTKRVVMAARDNEEVAAACCLAPTGTCNPATVARIESVAGRK